MNDPLNLLLHSFDNELTPEQATQLEAALANSPELREEKVRLLEMRALFSAAKMEADHTFVNRVMLRIEEVKSTSFSKVIVNLFPKVAAACVVFILATLIGIYVTEGTLSADAIMGIEDISVEEALTITEI